MSIDYNEAINRMNTPEYAQEAEDEMMMVEEMGAEVAPTLNHQKMKSEQLGIDWKERNEELLQAASWIDGYMKQHRRELLDVEQLAFYVAIRELVNLLGSEFKELNKEQIKVLISTEEDWKRYQSIPEAVGQIEDQ